MSFLASHPTLAAEHDADELRVLRTHLREHLRNHWIMIPLAFALAALGASTGAVRVHIPTTAAIATVGFFATVAGHVMLRRNRVSPFGVRLLVSIDGILISGFCAALGPDGYLILPIVLFVLGSTAMALPLAARNFAVSVALLYPLMRLGGGMLHHVTVSPLSVLVEWGFLTVAGGLLYVRLAGVTERLSHIRAMIGRIAAGDLTVRLPVTADDNCGLLSVSVNRMSEQVGGLVRELQLKAAEMAAQAQQLAATVEEVDASASHASAAAGSTVTEAGDQLVALERGQATLGRLAAHGGALLGESSSAAHEARAVAAGTGEQVARISQTGVLVMELRDSFRRSTVSIDALDAARREIDVLVSAIQEIASRTNLLALNAAIEAARAGEHGRGFGVVADEVRKLATESGTSAAKAAGVVQETRVAIDQVREQIQSSNENLEGVRSAAEAGQEALHALVEGLEAAIGSVERINVEVEAHAGAVNELLDAMGAVREITEHTLDRIGRVAETAEQQSVAMGEVSETSQYLAETAQALAGLAESFDVGGLAEEAAAPAVSVRREPPAPPPAPVGPPRRPRRRVQLAGMRVVSPE